MESPLAIASATQDVGPLPPSIAKQNIMYGTVKLWD